MEPVQSLTYLLDNAPRWLVELDELQAKCEVQFERFTRITQYGEVKLTRKKKHASTESLRPAKDDDNARLVQSSDAAEIGSEVPSSVPKKEINTVEPVSQRIPRKRRAGSDASGLPSNQGCRYRTKNMVVVYYDSDIQEAFERLVKSIATARNNLRKGKNTATFKLRMSSMGLGSSTSDKPSDRMQNLALDSKMLITPGLSKTRSGQAAAASDLKPFEETDRGLEEAQSFCEKGAHQFLRDGDCTLEIDGTRKRFADCQVIAQNAVERMKQEANLPPEMEAEHEDAAEERTLVGDSTPPSDSLDTKMLDINAPDKMDPPPLEEMKFAGTGAIEIDDGSDSESLQIDMTAIRRTVRSTRV